MHSIFIHAFSPHLLGAVGRLSKYFPAVGGKFPSAIGPCASGKQFAIKLSICK